MRSFNKIINLIYFMQNKLFKNKITSERPKRNPKESYLAKAKFVIGLPSRGGHSEAVMVCYNIDGTKAYWYSKDCKNLAQNKCYWSFERYGLPYLQNIYKNGGDEHTKLDVSKANMVLIYPTIGKNQKPTHVLYDRRAQNAATQKPKSQFILLAPKRMDLRTESDKYFPFFSDDQFFKDGKIDIESTLKSLFHKYQKWEDKTDPKSMGQLLVYDIPTRKPVAEMTFSGKFFHPKTNICMFPQVN